MTSVFAQARNSDYTRWASDYAFATENDSLHDYIVFFPGKVVFRYSNELQQYDIGEYSISHDTCTVKNYADEWRPCYCDGYYDTIKYTYLVSENELTLIDVQFHWIVKHRCEGDGLPNRLVYRRYEGGSKWPCDDLRQFNSAVIKGEIE